MSTPSLVVKEGDPGRIMIKDEGAITLSMSFLLTPREERLVLLAGEGSYDEIPISPRVLLREERLSYLSIAEMDLQLRVRSVP